MNLEFYDVFSIFMAGLALGLIGAHYLNRHELKLEYERGKLDAVWAIQCEIMRSKLASRLKSAGDKAAGSEACDSKPV
jgi:hypothetical protein